MGGKRTVRVLELQRIKVDVAFEISRWRLEAHDFGRPNGGPSNMVHGTSLASRKEVYPVAALPVH